MIFDKKIKDKSDSCSEKEIKELTDKLKRPFLPRTESITSALALGRRL